MLFLVFLVLIYPLGVDLYLTGLTAIASDLNASEVTLHHAFSIYLMGMVSSMLIAGWCSDNLGRKPVILFGTLIFLSVIKCWAFDNGKTVLDFTIFSR